MGTPESNSSSSSVPSMMTMLRNSELSPAISPQTQSILRAMLVSQHSTSSPCLLALVAKSTLSGLSNRPPKTKTHLPSPQPKRLRKRNQRRMLKSKSRKAAKLILKEEEEDDDEE